MGLLIDVIENPFTVGLINAHMAEEPNVKITYEEKIFPEEDYKFEGTVNGKPWNAKQTMGHGASIFLETDDDVSLTDEEEQAVYDALWNY